MTDKMRKTDEEWREQLSDDQYRVTRQGGTERAFTGRFYNFRERGNYQCVCCGATLFDSRSKYDSGSGWPSYWQPLNGSAIRTEADTTHGMHRVEVLCARCDAHLGHVFEDGPPPTGLRYCINSIALNLKENG